MRVNQIDKRARKLNAITEEEMAPKIFGNEDAETTIVLWGSTKMPAMEALKILKDDEIDVKIMQVIFMNPFPSKKVLDILMKSKKTIIIEGNSTGQLRNLIMEKTGFWIESTYLKYDGRPFEAIDIANKVKEISGKQN